MKKKILMVFVLLASCGLSRNNMIQNGDTYKFISAYDYLAKRYEGKVVVSDTIVNIDIVNFFDEIAKDEKLEASKVIDSLMGLASDKNYENYKYQVKRILNNDNKKGNFKFYFSKPTNDYVMVEVFEINKNKGYEELTLFGSSDVFLFLFKEKEITDIYQIKLDYN